VLESPYVTQYLTEHFAEADYPTLEGYERFGGYEAARKALTEMAPDDVIEVVKTAGLQGRGGAGFPAGMKWSFMPKEDDRPKYLVCNADESEPGSFKDRILLERGAHQMLEGILIAAWATGASATFIYIRGEYAFPAKQVERAVAEAYRAGDTIVLLVVRSGGVEDSMVRGAVEKLRGDGRVAVFVTRAEGIARYVRITQSVAVDRVPALVIVRPRWATGGTPQATVEYGFRDAQSVVQALKDAVYQGRTVPYHPG